MDKLPSFFECATKLLITNPNLLFDYIIRMPKEEYFIRLNANELSTVKKRYENVVSILDERDVINDTRKVGENQIAFNITHPYQKIDYPFLEATFLGRKAERSEESFTIEELEKRDRERFERIKEEVEEEFNRKDKSI